MANKKKLIQSSKTLNILEDYSFVLFIQQPQKKYMSNLTKLVTSYQNEVMNSTNFISDQNNISENKKIIQIFRYKNTIIKKCISNFDSKRKKEFQNIFQGPNILVAGNDLTKLPSLWKSLNSIPHIFFCGAIIDKTLYNHLDLEKAIYSVYNTSSQEVYNRLVVTLTEATQLNAITRDFEYKISAILNSLNTQNSNV